jgi:hypothetical protein
MTEAGLHETDDEGEPKAVRFHEPSAYMGSNQNGHSEKGLWALSSGWAVPLLPHTSTVHLNALNCLLL